MESTSLIIRVESIGRRAKGEGRRAKGEGRRAKGEGRRAKGKEAGTRFAFIKATEGSTFKDSRFAINRSEATKAGIACGFYHFFRPRSDVTAQANYFIKTAGKLEKGELPPVLDIENPAPWACCSMKKRLAMIARWIQKVEGIFDVTPIVYLSPSFATDTLG